MERILSSETVNKIGEKVLLKGWLHSLRMLGAVSFLVVRDRGGFVQVVILDKEELKKVKDLQPGSILEVEAEVQQTEQTELKVELINPKITVTNPVTSPWPVETNKFEVNANMDTILDFRPLTLRNEKIAAVFKIQSTILEAYREFLIENGFIEFMGPAIIGASSEGGAELFNVDYFGVNAKLAQSNQLYKQIMTGVFERVFGSLKCFRAEKSNTTRHVTEATQLEFEMGFINEFSEILDWEERVIRSIFEKVQEKNAKELSFFDNKSVLPEDVRIPRVTLKEALEIYYKEKGVDQRSEPDLSPDAEKFISAYAKEKFGTDLIFVTHFPRKKCAFYAKPNEQSPTVCNYADLICNGVEISSGGQRIENYDQLVESLKLKGLNPEDFKDYLSIFRYGMPKHGGFGLGLERFTKQLLGLENIREAILFPSDTKRIAAVPYKRKVKTGEELMKEIIDLLVENKIEYKLFEHEATVTSEDAARIRGTNLSEGVKALILKGKKSGRNIQVNVSADRKIDMKKLELITGEPMTFEKPEVILEKYGLEVGGVPPFGNLLGLDTYFDNKVLNQEQSDFNCGTRYNSIMMKSSDLVRLVGPKMLDITIS